MVPNEELEDAEFKRLFRILWDILLPLGQGTRAATGIGVHTKVPPDGEVGQGRIVAAEEFEEPLNTELGLEGALKGLVLLSPQPDNVDELRGPTAGHVLARQIARNVVRVHDKESYENEEETMLEGGVLRGVEAAEDGHQHLVHDR